MPKMKILPQDCSLPTVEYVLAEKRKPTLLSTPWRCSQIISGTEEKNANKMALS